ncbi:MAG: glycosyltransferase family 4 protein [Isosphaeraceae bacterium]
MNLVVTVEQRFLRLPDGSYWSPNGFARSFWDRYLEVFDGIRVVARVAESSSVPTGWERSDGPGISFAPVPYYVGPWQYLVRALGVRDAVRRAVGAADAVLMRVASRIASVLEPALSGARHPFGLEVVGDPYETFAPGAVRHPLRPIVRRWMTRELRRQCRAACSVAYVTERTLQSRYPASAGTFLASYSSIELGREAFVAAPRPSSPVLARPSLLAIGSLSQPYKGFDVLIDAIALCRLGGIETGLVILGDGRYRTEIESRVSRRGLSGAVRFAGQVPPGAAVRAELDRADLFVMPSRTEGLPRAMLEAMARALPCVGSSIGGIPELLPAEDLAPPGDAAALARLIVEVLKDPGRMQLMSARNLMKAGEYRAEILASRRRAHYRYLRERTEAWLGRGGGE